MARGNDGDCAGVASAAVPGEAAPDFHPFREEDVTGDREPLGGADQAISLAELLVAILNQGAEAIESNRLDAWFDGHTR